MKNIGAEKLYDKEINKERKEDQRNKEMARMQELVVRANKSELNNDEENELRSCIVDIINRRMRISEYKEMVDDIYVYVRMKGIINYNPDKTKIVTYLSKSMLMHGMYEYIANVVHISRYGVETAIKIIKNVDEYFVSPNDMQEYLRLNRDVVLDKINKKYKKKMGRKAFERNIESVCRILECRYLIYR